MVYGGVLPAREVTERCDLQEEEGLPPTFYLLSFSIVFLKLLVSPR